MTLPRRNSSPRTSLLSMQPILSATRESEIHADETFAPFRASLSSTSLATTTTTVHGSCWHVHVVVRPVVAWVKRLGFIFELAFLGHSHVGGGADRFDEHDDGARGGRSLGRSGACVDAGGPLRRPKEMKRYVVAPVLCNT